MVGSIRIADRLIGEEQPTYIIAEIGINHNGDEKTARSLIDVAVEAKVDAVKFQKRKLSALYPREVLDHPERYEQSFQYMIPLLKRVELSEEVLGRLHRYARERNLHFLCTPFDISSADFLAGLDLPAFKVASADLTNNMLLQHLCHIGKPILLSTGMSSWEEIQRAVALLKKNEASFALLHCRSVYPVWPREVNLRRINRLKSFNVPVGYSGHELGITISLVAASMGASIVEKHITLDRRQEGPDHKVSLEPYELKRLVRDIRVADQAIGREKRYLLRGEVMNRELFGKSLTAVRAIPKGTIIDRSLVVARGPGKGLPPDRIDDLLGRVMRRDLEEGGLFLEQDVEEETKEPFWNKFTSQWGLIARFTDWEQMLAYKPKVIEFHLAERDFDILFSPTKSHECRLIVHAPEYLNEMLMDLCSASEEIRKMSVDLVAKTIRLTASIAPFFQGIAKVICHPGAMSLQDKLDPRRLQDALTRSLKELREIPETAQVQLLFENLPPYPWYFGGQWKGNYFMDGEEIAEFCRKNDMQICFDLSHAALYCNAKEKDLAVMIQTLLPYISHLHLADGYGLDGEGVQFGEGDIVLEEIMPLFKGFTGTWVPEIWRGHLEKGRGFLEGLEYLSRWMD